jgi:hypothetical protein
VALDLGGDRRGDGAPDVPPRVLGQIRGSAPATVEVVQDRFGVGNVEDVVEDLRGRR